MNMNEEDENKGYIHPVCVKIDQKTSEYHTISEQEEPDIIREVHTIPTNAQGVTCTEDEFFHANLRSIGEGKYSL